LAFGARAAWRHQLRLCEGAEQKLIGVWDSERRRAIETAFQATSRVYAADAWSTAQRVLDAKARAWSVMHTEACEATRLRGEQSEADLSLRMTCLDRRLTELKSLSNLFATADVQTVEHAVQAASALPTVDTCADLQTLRAPVQPPADPATRAKVAAIRQRLDSAKPFRSTGRYQDGLAAVAPLVEEARLTQYPPIQAETQIAWADFLTLTGDAKTAEGAYWAGIDQAEEGHDDSARALGWVHLIQNLGPAQNHLTEAASVAQRAHWILRRVGDPPQARADLLDAWATVLRLQGRYDDAVEKSKKALEIRERRNGSEDFSVAFSHNNLVIERSPSTRRRSAVSTLGWE
jgi:serine/threonine-protein kinase